MTKHAKPRTKAQAAQALARVVCGPAPVDVQEISALAQKVDLTLAMEHWAREIPPGPISQQARDNLDTLLSLYKPSPDIPGLFDELVKQDKWEAMLCLAHNFTRPSTINDFARKTLSIHPTDQPQPVRALLSYLAFRISGHIEKVLEKVLDERTASVQMNVAIFSTSWNLGGMDMSMDLLRDLVQGMGPEVFNNNDFAKSLEVIERKASLVLPYLPMEMATGSEVRKALDWISSAQKKRKLTALSKSPSTTFHRNSTPKM